jgi:hypothetical protein
MVIAFKIKIRGFFALYKTGLADLNSFRIKTFVPHKVEVFDTIIRN